MKKHNQLLRGFLVVTAGLLLGLITLFFTDQKQVPAKAQAQELFALYFEMDHVRQDSAQIFAELMVVAKDPGRVQAVQAIGSKPPLSSHEELAASLKENQAFVEETLETINANKFTDSEVQSRYEEVRSFYTTLFEFENMVLAELTLVENNEERSIHLATTLFEGALWPALLAQDTHLRETLSSLAALHGLEFNPLPYEDIFRERLAELDTPLVSDDVNTVVYPFTVNDPVTVYVLLNVTFDIPLTEKIDIFLEDPYGHLISSNELAEYSDSDNSAELNHLSYVYRSDSVIIVKLFPEDPKATPTPGDWKFYVTAPVGSTMVIGMIQL